MSSSSAVFFCSSLSAAYSGSMTALNSMQRVEMRRHHFFPHRQLVRQRGRLEFPIISPDISPMLLALARIASATAFQSGSWASVIFSSVFRKASRPSTCPAMAAIIGILPRACQSYPDHAHHRHAAHSRH